jgi:hypothetical protein
MNEPITTIESGVAWYYEGEEAKTKHEGTIEIYPSWVRLSGGLGITAWIPRDRVEQVHES